MKQEFERLWFDNQLLLKFESGDVEIFKDNYTRDSQYSFNWLQSVLPSLLPKADNFKITWFKERIARFIRSASYSKFNAFGKSSGRNPSN